MQIFSFHKIALFFLLFTSSAVSVQYSRADECPELTLLENAAAELDVKLPLARIQAERYLSVESARISGDSKVGWIPILFRLVACKLSPWFWVDQAFLVLLTPTEMGRSSKDSIFLLNPLLQLSPEDWGTTRQEVCALHSVSGALAQHTFLATRFIKAILKDAEKDGDGFRLVLPPRSYE